jgi:predicted SAM-dependent methyltransferase
MTSLLRRILPSRRPPAGPRSPLSAAPGDAAPLRLHVGAGRERLEGWVNIDVQDLPGVDVVADVTRGLDFSDAEAVYAEHFLEHLRADQAIDFLAECHRCLVPGGLLRLSTPNLDWVWHTHYPAAPAESSAHAGAGTNRAFHGWRHRFLWNRELLAVGLEACGFEDLAWCRWGESEHEVFRGIERHETYADAPGAAARADRRGGARRRAAGGAGRAAGDVRGGAAATPGGLAPEGAAVGWNRSGGGGVELEARGVDRPSGAV